MKNLTREDLVKVFTDTLDRSATIYKHDTLSAMKNKEIYARPIADFEFMPHQILPNKNMNVEVVNGGTAEIGVNEARKGKKVAVLNFADGCVPGGLVLSGEHTQEENLCRCSNLYSILATKECEDAYYTPNRYTKSVYLDTIIYGNDILFFKDDVDYNEILPVRMDVITCPAPSAYLHEGYAREVIERRAEQIIKVAAKHNVQVLILGAWGCGAFGQSPEIVSDAFIKALKKYPAFESVLFAIRGCKCDSDGTYNDIWHTFKRKIEEEYGRKSGEEI